MYYSPICNNAYDLTIVSGCLCVLRVLTRWSRSVHILNGFFFVERSNCALQSHTRDDDWLGIQQQIQSSLLQFVWLSQVSRSARVEWLLRTERSDGRLAMDYAPRMSWNTRAHTRTHTRTPSAVHTHKCNRVFSRMCTTHALGEWHFSWRNREPFLVDHMDGQSVTLYMLWHIWLCPKTISLDSQHMRLFFFCTVLPWPIFTILQLLGADDGTNSYVYAARIFHDQREIPICRGKRVFGHARAQQRIRSFD